MESNHIGLEELKGNLFGLGLEQAQRFIRTSKALELYAGTNLSKEMWTLLHNGTETDPDEPVRKKEGEKPSRGKIEKYKMELKMWMDKREQ